MYSEKATKFYEIFTLLLTVFTVVKSKVKISQNFVAFPEYMNLFSPRSAKRRASDKDLHVINGQIEIFSILQQICIG